MKVCSFMENHKHWSEASRNVADINFQSDMVRLQKIY